MAACGDRNRRLLTLKFIEYARAHGKDQAGPWREKSALAKGEA